ncbi:hypothetical protein [uncultured Sphingomonas sp.]|uniref:hypothetical protein n=1 Tax=uncultured Sphingomonas sp. TaxID=158754 RepID=UPI0025DB8D34|nr:hypothetical protein [uncultured Sphingomonas sp.]
MSTTRVAPILAFDLAPGGLIAGAAVHLAAWFKGPRWMAALGAPPPIVSSAAAGSWPALLGKLAIAALLIGLALSCILVARKTAKMTVLRCALGLFAVIFFVRGLLVVPFIAARRREWRTPVGKMIVTGDWFAAGSPVVLAIGVLIGLGLHQTRSQR